MDHAKLTDALNGLTRRDLERLRVHIEQQLRACTICGAEGGTAYRVGSGNAHGSLVLCKPCFEKHRLPEGRAE